MLSDAKEEEWVSAPAPRHRAAPEENRLKNSCSCIAIFLLPLRSISIILLQYFFGCFAVLLWILCSTYLASFQYFARGKATQASCACAGVLTAARIHSHDWAVAAPTATAAATPAPPGRTEQLGFKPQSLLNSCFSMIEYSYILSLSGKTRQMTRSCGCLAERHPRAASSEALVVANSPRLAAAVSARPRNSA